jgi:rRNA-processing protein FCF1
VGDDDDDLRSRLRRNGVKVAKMKKGDENEHDGAWRRRAYAVR